MCRWLLKLGAEAEDDLSGLNVSLLPEMALLDHRPAKHLDWGIGKNRSHHVVIPFCSLLGREKQKCSGHDEETLFDVLDPWCLLGKEFER